MSIPDDKEELNRLDTICHQAREAWSTQMALETPFTKAYYEQAFDLVFALGLLRGRGGLSIEVKDELMKLLEEVRPDDATAQP